MAADTVGHDDWRWLNQALFGTDEGFAVVPGRVTAGLRSAGRLDRWAVLPNTGAPRRLVPGDRRAAGASFANVHDAMSERRLRLGRLTRRAVKSGLPLTLAGVAGLPSELGVGGNPASSLLAEIGERLDAPGGSQVAITLGPRRYNRKPVVQLIGPDATTISFIKIACDAITQSFVDNETRWLRRAQTAGSSVLVPPAVMADWEARGNRMLAIAPVHPNRHDPGRLDAARLQSVANDIASLGPQHRASLREAAIIDRTVQAAAAANDDRLAAALMRTTDVFGDVVLELGPWHGDLTPWNTITSGSTTALLDWEFAADGMPVGADLIHNSVMVATHLADVPIADALGKTQESVVGLLTGFANAAEPRATFALYLLELARRDAQLAAEGQASTGFGSAALDMLDSVLDSVRGS